MPKLYVLAEGYAPESVPAVIELPTEVTSGS